MNLNSARRWLPSHLPAGLPHWGWLAAGALLLVILVGAARLASQPGQAPAAGLQARAASPEGTAAWAARPDLAQASAADSLSLGQTGVGDGSSITWAIVATVLVLGLAYGALWAARPFLQGRSLRRTNGPVELQSTVRLGPNQALHAVRFGSQLLLVASSPSGVNVLAQAPEPAASFGQALSDAMEAPRED